MAATANIPATRVDIKAAARNAMMPNPNGIPKTISAGIGLLSFGGGVVAGAIYSILLIFYSIKELFLLNENSNPQNKSQALMARERPIEFTLSGRDKKRRPLGALLHLT